jgi:hypothetical protein
VGSVGSIDVYIIADWAAKCSGHKQKTKQADGFANAGESECIPQFSSVEPTTTTNYLARCGTRRDAQRPSRHRAHRRVRVQLRRHRWCDRDQPARVLLHREQQATPEEVPRTDMANDYATWVTPVRLFSRDSFIFTGGQIPRFASCGSCTQSLVCGCGGLRWGGVAAAAAVAAATSPSPPS